MVSRYTSTRQEAAAYGTIVAKIPARQRTDHVGALIDRICSLASEEGFVNESLLTVVDTITQPQELDQASVSKLVRVLYPAQRVPDAVIIRVVNCLGHSQSKPSLTSQAALLRWLVLVHDVLQDPTVLSKLYAVLFNLLDTFAIRCVVCSGGSRAACADSL